MQSMMPYGGGLWNLKRKIQASRQPKAHPPKLARALPTVWSERTMPAAPEVIREVGERSGGVRAGQLIYARDAVVSVVPYGLWWPWGNGSTISLRVA